MPDAKALDRQHRDRHDARLRIAAKLRKRTGLLEKVEAIMVQVHQLDGEIAADKSALDAMPPGRDARAPHRK